MLKLFWGCRERQFPCTRPLGHFSLTHWVLLSGPHTFLFGFSKSLLAHLLIPRLVLVPSLLLLGLFDPSCWPDLRIKTEPSVFEPHFPKLTQSSKISNKPSLLAYFAAFLVHFRGQVLIWTFLHHSGPHRGPKSLIRPVWIWVVFWDCLFGIGSLFIVLIWSICLIVS